MKPSLLLAEDDSAFRDAARKLLEPEFRVVASVEDGGALIEAARILRPDLIVTDISMPGLNGLQAIRRLKSVQPDLRVIFLTLHMESAYLAEAEKIGALGYVLKQCVVSDLIPAVREALHGRFFLSPALLAHISPGTPTAYKNRGARSHGTGCAPRDFCGSNSTNPRH